MNMFAYHENAAGGEEPASSVANTPLEPTGLGDVAVFIGHIQGREAERFIELNQEHIWNSPRRGAPQESDDETDDEESEPWRGQMHAAIPLDGPILCHSFPKPSKRPNGWRHGAETRRSREKGERPCDMVYPLNAKSGISSSMFRIDFAPNPEKKPTPRITPEMRHPQAPIRIERGTNTLRRGLGHSEILDQPAKIYLNDNDPGCLSFWVWSPVRNAAEQKVFIEHIKALYNRGNCLDETHFPGVTSAGGSTMAPSRAGYETRTGLTGTVYQIDGELISHGSFRDVYPVKIIGQPVCNLVMPKQTATQKRLAEMLKKEAGKYQLKPPQLRLVAKVVRLKGDDSQSTQDYREMLEKEAEFVQSHPHFHINTIYDIAYKPGADDRPWLIEQRQDYCLDDEWLPLTIDKPDMAKQIICGLKHIHDHDSIHRDMKPANIMLELVEFHADGLDLGRWVVKFTDHGMVASTDYMVEGRCGSPWHCAPEVLDSKRYSKPADIFSTGVVLLCMFAEYDPNRQRSNWSPSSSSDVRQWMIEEVDLIIEKKCPREYRVLLKGMLEKRPKARWNVDKCLDFLLRGDQSQTRDSSFSIAPTLPWTTEPFTEEQKQESLMRKEEALRRDGVVESDDGLSESDRTVTPGAPSLLADDRLMEDDVPATPKLTRPMRLPVTPCQGLAGEDALPSAACTPVFGDGASVRAVKRVTAQPASYDFSVTWDWHDPEGVSGSGIRWRSLPPPRVSTSEFSKPRPKPGLHLGIADVNWGFNPHPQTKAQLFSPPQQLTENMTNMIQNAEGEDSEAETEILGGNEDPEVLPDTRDDNDSEAETVRHAQDRGPEASHSSRRVARTNAPTNNDHENAAPDDYKPIFLQELARNRKRRALFSTQANKRNRNGLYISFCKEVGLGNGRRARVIR
ncbi:hypothetical protein Z517_09203 [Fonsecaea pedrosoi CBS 271.37]|uniref:non-specific serine/threonine protein kinase n=1 Tax=Fonsecaea pedrosoi CBS 271.37 TaxID=1442368 RepID=A0A0D2GWM1_9EURO|nr:uncharacterized protein Z517_09203 [Fonsecaea pedrosoi CBS 271.37]KIW76759.1 hypothetical protein Z517_09203 [Fonsecaea pedrosoi CBS 271.37]